MKQCDKTAKYAIPWAGKIVKQCEEHTRQVLALAQAIGSICQPVPIKTKEKCTQQIKD